MKTSDRRQEQIQKISKIFPETNKQPVIQRIEICWSVYNKIVAFHKMCCMKTKSFYSIAFLLTFPLFVELTQVKGNSKKAGVCKNSVYPCMRRFNLSLKVFFVSVLLHLLSLCRHFWFPQPVRLLRAIPTLLRVFVHRFLIKVAASLCLRVCVGVGVCC